MTLCRVNQCESETPCQIECRDCGEHYSSDERECPECYLRTCMQVDVEGCVPVPVTPQPFLDRLLSLPIALLRLVR